MEPSGPPPSYEEAAGPSSSSKPANSNLDASNNPTTHKTRNGIPPHYRRSMEDEARPLPEGWVRSFDPKTSHQFFVDTTKDPPRSIWHHPYDDDAYLKTLDPQERERLENMRRHPSQADIEAESSDDDDGHQSHPGQSASGAHNSPPPQGVKKFGRKMKDKLTNSTHEEREANRKLRAEQERKAYERHHRIRQAMARAAETGQPQLIGKGDDGKDVYIEPPNGGDMPPGANGYNPYQQGPYAQGPTSYTRGNATYIRPQYPYQRPYGPGYGGGLGYGGMGYGGYGRGGMGMGGMGMPLMGGLLGGLLLTDLLI